MNYQLSEEYEDKYNENQVKEQTIEQALKILVETQRTPTEELALNTATTTTIAQKEDQITAYTENPVTINYYSTSFKQYQRIRHLDWRIEKLFNNNIIVRLETTSIFIIKHQITIKIKLMQQTQKLFGKFIVRIISTKPEHFKEISRIHRKDIFVSFDKEAHPYSQL